MKKIFLSDLDSWNRVIEEESSAWVKELIIFAKLDQKIVFGPSKGAAVEYLINEKTHIDFDIRTSSIKIQKDGVIIGEWKTPIISTKIDNDGRPFAEISVDTWSIKDKPNTESKIKR